MPLARFIMLEIFYHFAPARLQLLNGTYANRAQQSILRQMPESIVLFTERPL